MTDLEKFEELFKSVGVGYSVNHATDTHYITLHEHSSFDIECEYIGVDFDFNLDGSFQGVDVG